MPLPTYGSSQGLPGTSKYRENHPFNWLSQANYNPLYDPGSAGYQSNLENTSKGYQSPSTPYVGGNPNNTVNPNSGAGLMVTGGPMHTAPMTVSSTTVPYGQYIAGNRQTPGKRAR